ncbi:DUF411 domain-containing protein [Neisseria sp. Ec49-e6-T10]|uniref:DUF411 domain-containing protein n=1 Tax=Neisseria sp. Ec49-e6-T10 TaxID=3140744 RepID=UPI003EBAC799
MSRLFVSTIIATVFLTSQPLFAAPAPVLATIHKSPTCGCCEAYADYLQKNGFNVKTINHDNMRSVQVKLGTSKAPSCHTMQIGQYVVEGHVPVASIQKLLKEQPDIKGIALPGMPATSPGMGPAKKGILKVVKLDHKGNPRGVFLVE